MRATTLIRTLLKLNQTRICSVGWNAEGMVVDIAPSHRRPRCSGCGFKSCSPYDTYKGREWRHLDLAGMKLVLRYDIRRVKCKRCGVRNEKVPWAPAGSWFTYQFEDMVGYLAQRCDKTSVSSIMRIDWKTVGRIIQRVVERHGRKDRLEGLRIIGLDEISYRRHHKYLTVVIDHQRGEVVWMKPGKDAKTLKAFFDELGKERCGQLEAVTLDMSAAYIKAVTECSEGAKLIFDRFHVQKLAHDALDEVRRAEVRDVDDPDDKRALKKTRWPLQKNPWNLERYEVDKLSELQRHNKPLYRAYLLKQSLIAVLDRRQVNVARRKLDEWIAWACRSRLEPFKKLARTIRKHMDGILEYVRTRLSNGRVEGTNRKIRAITSRSYGFHSPDSLMAMIFLCCGGIHLQPVHTYPAT